VNPTHGSVPTCGWSLEPAADSTRVVFDHTGFAAKDEILRTVTLGWAQMLLRLAEYARTRSTCPTHPSGTTTSTLSNG